MACIKSLVKIDTHWHSPKSVDKYDAKADVGKCIESSPNSSVDEVFGAPKSEGNKEFVDKILMQF